MTGPPHPLHGLFASQCACAWMGSSAYRAMISAPLVQKRQLRGSCFANHSLLIQSLQRRLPTGMPRLNSARHAGSHALSHRRRRTLPHSRFLRGAFGSPPRRPEAAPRVGGARVHQASRGALNTPPRRTQQFAGSGLRRGRSEYRRLFLSPSATCGFAVPKYFFQLRAATRSGRGR